MPSDLTKATLGERFGFDADWREQQLSLAGLTVIDSEAVQALQELLGQGRRIDSVVEQFYQRLEACPQAANILTSFEPERLKDLQAGFLRSLGEGLGSAGFFEARISLAMRHLQLGVSAAVYMAAFGYLQALLHDQIIQAAKTKKLSRGLVALVSKLALLDTLIAHDVYSRALPETEQHMPQQSRPSYETYNDPLQLDISTGAAGRLTLLKAVDNALTTARRTGQPLSLIMVVLDSPRTKAEISAVEIEPVLREVATRLKACVRGFDLVGRYGAQSFLLLLENTSLHTCHQVAERVWRRIREKPAMVDGSEIRITVSQGLTDALSQDDQGSLLQRCQHALEQARATGGDSICEDVGLVVRR